MNARAVRLPDRFYLPRTDAEGREVRDLMPWEGAVGYATDGKRLGIQYPDGTVVWLGLAGPGGSPPDGDAADGEGAVPDTFADDFEGVNLDALVDGLRSYISLHPVLRTVWQGDVESLDALRHRTTGDDDGS